MIAATRTQKPTNAGLEPTIRKYLDAQAYRKELEKEARLAEKEEKILERAITDAVEQSGGMLEAGQYLMEMEELRGVPSYKTIAEKHIAPAVLLAEIEATPKRRKLKIV